MSNKDCLTKSGFKSFLAGDFSPVKKDSVEMHLANCKNCRQTVAMEFADQQTSGEDYALPASLKGEVMGIPKQSHNAEDLGKSEKFGWFKFLNRRPLQVGFAALLIGGFGFVGIYLNREQPVKEDVFRSGTLNALSLNLLMPENNSNISGKSMDFRWSAVEGAKIYTFVISDEKGDIIKEISTNDTNLSAQISELGLLSDGRYFWRVKARLIDGSVVESEIRKINVARK